MANTKITSRVIADDAVGIDALNVSDGSNGQVLTTNGSGTLSFSTVSGTTINNNADNRVITGSGTANTLEGETALTFDGNNNLKVLAAGNTTTGGNIQLGITTDDAAKYTAITAQQHDSGTETEGFTLIGGNSAANDSNLVNIGGGFGEQNPATALRFFTGSAATREGTLRATIDSSGNVGIGTASPFGTTSNRTVLSVNGTSSATLNIGTGGSQRAYLFTDGSSAQVATVGAIPLKLGTNDTERVRILSSGGLTFNGDTATANALDDYEEGTWRPTVAGATSAGSYVYGENAGVYTKIGNQVTCSFYILQLGANTEGSGALIINNLPFTVASITAGTVLDYFTGNVTFENFDVHTNTRNLASHAIAGTTHITFFETKDSALDGTVVTTDRVDGNADIIGQITYRTT